MSAQAVFKRALILMEFDRLDEAESSLREAIGLAEDEKDESTLVSAMCCLGDYLFSLGKDEEAGSWLKRVLTHRGDNPSLEDEFAMADEFLYEMGNRNEK